MLGCKGTEERELTGKHTCPNDLCQFFRIRAGRISASCHA
jgi:hypothetical protein